MIKHTPSGKKRGKIQPPAHDDSATIVGQAERRTDVFRREETIAAIRRYHDATERQKSAVALQGEMLSAFESEGRKSGDDGPEWKCLRRLSRWTDVAYRFRIEAESRLIEAILLWDERIEFKTFRDRAAMRIASEAHGFEHQDRLYLAVPNPDSDAPIGQQDPSGTWAMRLIVVDIANVVGL
jgi:hypothetical protein